MKPRARSETSEAPPSTRPSRPPERSDTGPVSSSVPRQVPSSRPPRELRATSEWGESEITPSEARSYALRVRVAAPEQEAIVRCLGAFPRDCRVRGVFFEGLSRIVSRERGRAAHNLLLADAGVPERTAVFKTYPHRDFYKLYFVAARLLHENATLAESLRLTAQTFWPIFLDSMLGRTFAALVSQEPYSVFRTHAKAHEICVAPNEHAVDRSGPRQAIYRCRAETSPWYPSILCGILEGATLALGSGQKFSMELTSAREYRNGYSAYEFALAW